MKNPKIIKLNPSKIKQKNYNRNNIKNRNYNFNSQSFTESNHTNNKFTETDEDLKMENKTFNLKIRPNTEQLKNEININSEIDTKKLYNTDEKLNIKSKKNELMDKIKNNFNNNYGN